MEELDLITAGSHMGLIKNEESFPVGKTNFLYMFPMSFFEFVKAVNADTYEYLLHFNFTKPIPQIVHEDLLKLFECYLFTGGLPEVVKTFVKTNSVPQEKNILEAISKTRKIQNELVEGYRADFAKYSEVVNANHINYVFNSIPTQLSSVLDESVKKYQFKSVIPKRKGFESIAGPLSWLMESRLCIKNQIVKKSLHPLTGYTKDNYFKLFLFDVGILNSILAIPGEVILDSKIGPYKGFIMENFVSQELYERTNANLFSWQEGKAELEFIIVKGKNIIPVEVKSSNRTRKSKSLDSFIERYSPDLAIKLTMQNFSINKNRKITTLPIYLCSKLL